MKFLTTTTDNNIPQNGTKFFDINIKCAWKNSLDVVFDPFDEIILLNLFLILKSYLNENLPKIKQVYTISYKLNLDEKNQENLIFRSINVLMLKKFEFEEFSNWYFNKFEEDYEYIKSDYKYGFRLIFFSESLSTSNLNLINKLHMLKPIYPWPNLLISQTHLTKFDLNELKKFKLLYENKLLKKKLKQLNKKLEHFNHKN